MFNRIFGLVLIGLIVLPGCIGKRNYTQGNVSIGEVGTTRHLEAKLTFSDFSKLAKDVTNKMVDSKRIQWFDANDKPKNLVLCVATPINKTDDENFEMDALQDKIDERLLQREMAIITTSPPFDYIIRPTLYANPPQRGEGGKLQIQYTLQYKLYDDKDRKLGQWSSEMVLNRDPS
ncbi:hypothetical protein [Desulfovibrio gilichinskyi]|uniref:Lipoprotein n=1 Tax=Desulfovibrio gilichinskyi TaxID=1519643 RepID=A0A1X7C0P5_9BACT|nr:hypothetical protein [Desulfovibrio gilichinskyi]SME87849.1 hypothetical protein SAMN06295933_0059 [Desulfovibrio gilichinskyi]